MTDINQIGTDAVKALKTIKAAQVTRAKSIERQDAMIAVRNQAVKPLRS